MLPLPLPLLSPLLVLSLLLVKELAVEDEAVAALGGRFTGCCCCGATGAARPRRLTGIVNRIPPMGPPSASTTLRLKLESRSGGASGAGVVGEGASEEALGEPDAARDRPEFAPPDGTECRSDPSVTLLGAKPGESALTARGGTMGGMCGRSVTEGPARAEEMAAAATAAVEAGGDCFTATATCGTRVGGMFGDGEGEGAGVMSSSSSSSLSLSSSCSSELESPGSGEGLGLRLGDLKRERGVAGEGGEEAARGVSVRE